MATTALFAALMLAQTAALPANLDVGYNELANGNAEAAISRIESNRDIDNQDPAALINLGTAYARMGMKDEARACFTRAIASPDRYELQLADGTWMDSRAAARLALADLDRPHAIAAR